MALVNVKTDDRARATTVMFAPICHLSIADATSKRSRAGVGVGVTLVGVYILSGLCSALEGVLLTGFSGQASLGMGDEYLLRSIAVVAVGGTLSPAVGPLCRHAGRRIRAPSKSCWTGLRSSMPCATSSAPLSSAQSWSCAVGRANGAIANLRRIRGQHLCSAGSELTGWE